MNAPHFDWSVAIFGVNESSTIERCVLSIESASRERRTHVTILLNGTTDDSLQKLKGLRLSKNMALSVFLYRKADKANAINQFIHELRPAADAYFFIDAYTRIGVGSLEAIAAEMAVNPHALTVTGVPVNGRSAESTTRATLKGGVVSGQLYGLQKEFMARLVDLGLRLPLNLYRGDALIGSMACHNLDPLHTKWDDKRAAGVANASFEISPLSPFRWSDIKRQFNREIRQARGRIENAAIKSIIYSKGYGALPVDSDEMINGYLAKNPTSNAKSLRQRYFNYLCRKRIANSKTCSQSDLTPTMVHAT